MLTRSTRSGAAAYARNRLTGHSLHHPRSHGHSLHLTRPQPPPHTVAASTSHGHSLHLTRSQPPPHTVTASFRHIRLQPPSHMVAGSTRRASPTWPRRWCSTRRRRQSSGRSRLERALFCATPRRPCLPRAAAVLPQLPPLPLPPRAGAVSGAPRLGSPASQGWHGWLWAALRTLEERPCRAESLVRGRGRGTHASAQGADPESSHAQVAGGP